MKRRRGLTATRKQSAVLRCKDIEAALQSLLMEVLNGEAYSPDMDRVAALARGVQRLRYRFESYPELAEETPADWTPPLHRPRAGLLGG